MICYKDWVEVHINLIVAILFNLFMNVIDYFSMGWFIFNDNLFIHIHGNHLFAKILITVMGYTSAVRGIKHVKDCLICLKPTNCIIELG